MRASFKATSLALAFLTLGSAYAADDSPPIVKFYGPSWDESIMNGVKENRFDILIERMDWVDNIHELVDENGDSLLHHAARNLNREIFIFLIKMDPNFEEHLLRENYAKENPLSILLSQLQRQRIAVSDITRGIDDFRRIQDKAYIREIMKRYYTMEHVIKPDEARLDRPAERKSLYPLHIAAARGEEAAVLNFLSEGYSPFDDINEQGLIPIQIAALHNRIKILKIFLQHASSDYKLSVVLWASNNSLLETIRYLHEEHHVSLGVYDSRSGNSPLHFAAMKGDIRLAEYFLDNVDSPKIWVERKNNSDETALHLAAKHKHSDFYRFLVSKGAERTEKDSEGRSPEDYYKQLFHNPLSYHAANLLGPFLQKR